MGFDESTILRASQIDRTAPKITGTAAKAANTYHDVAADILGADSQWLLPPPPVTSNLATKKYERQKTIVSRAHLQKFQWSTSNVGWNPLFERLQMRFEG